MAIEEEEVGGLKNEMTGGQNESEVCDVAPGFAPAPA